MLACGASQRARPTARMLAHPSGSALPNLPSESFAFCGAFPANRKIAFGGGRLAVHCFSHRSVPLWSRCSPRLHEARWRGTSRRHSATAFASGLSPAHPSAQAGAWTGAEYRPRPLRLACAASPQSRRPQKLWPRGRRRRFPPALEALLYGASGNACAYPWRKSGCNLHSQEFVRNVFS